MTSAPKRTHEVLAGNTDTSFLKVLALVIMLVDHLGVVIFPSIPEMRVIGRIAFPLYAWSLVVGCVKTSNPWKYMGRMLGLALLSQPLYMMALNHSWKDLNILFTLLLAIAAIQGIRMHWLGSEIWVPALCYVVLGFVNVDYGWKGLTFILLLYTARGSRSGLAATFLAYALYWGTTSSSVSSLFGYQLSFLRWPGLGQPLSALFRLQGMIWLALPLILCRMNTKFHMPKWLGYSLYPMHLVLMVILRLMTGTTWELVTRGF